MYKNMVIALLVSLSSLSSAFAADFRLTEKDYPEAEAPNKMRKISSESESKIDEELKKESNEVELSGGTLRFLPKVIIQKIYGMVDGKDRWNLNKLCKFTRNHVQLYGVIVISKHRYSRELWDFPKAVTNKLKSLTFRSPFSNDKKVEDPDSEFGSDFWPLADLLYQCPRLLSLDLKLPSLGEETIEAIFGEYDEFAKVLQKRSGALKSLRLTSARGSRMASGLNSRQLHPLRDLWKTLKSLEELEMELDPNDQAALEFLTPLANLPQLKKVALSNLSLTPERFGFITGLFAKQTQLEAFCLTGIDENYWDNAVNNGAAHLLPISNCDSLTTILKNNTKLTTLSLEGFKVDNAFCHTLSNLSNLRQLCITGPIFRNEDGNEDQALYDRFAESLQSLEVLKLTGICCSLMEIEQYRIPIEPMRQLKTFVLDYFNSDLLDYYFDTNLVKSVVLTDSYNIKLWPIVNKKSQRVEIKLENVRADQLFQD